MLRLLGARSFGRPNGANLTGSHYAPTAVSSAQCEVTEAQSLAKVRANVLRQHDSWPLGGSDCALRIVITGLVVSVLLVTGDRQKTTELASALIDSKARDLAFGINVVAKDQIQRGGAGLYKGVEVGHHSVLPDKSTGGVLIIGRADYCAAVVEA